MRLFTVICFTLFGVSTFSAIGVLAYADEVTIPYLIGLFFVPAIFLVGGVTSLRKKTSDSGK